MGFLLNLKQNCPRSKAFATFLLNIYQIQLILTLLIGYQTIFINDVMQFIYHKADENSGIPIYALLSCSFIVLGLTIFQGNISAKSALYSKTLHSTTIGFVKIFPYLGFIPLMSFSISGLMLSQITLQVASACNIILFIVLTQMNDVSNWAYRFIQVDFCNQRYSNQIYIAIQVIYLLVLQLINPFYAAFLFLARGIMKLINIYFHYDFPLIQKVHMFYGLYSIFIAGIVFGKSFFGYEVLKNIIELSFLTFTAALICFNSIKPIMLRINYDRVRNSQQLAFLDNDQRQGASDKLDKAIEQAQNVLRILTNVYLERQKMLQDQPNSYNNWWQIFNRVIMTHRIKCQKPKCFCSTSFKDNYKNQSFIYITQLLKISDNICQLNTKMNNLKIMSIYEYIEIAKKPLKAYYQIMRLKQQKISNDTLIELEYLTKQTRECFDQVFLKNKAKNQQLQLLKVIQYQQLMIGISKNIDQIIDDVINFHEMFMYSTVETLSIKKQSKKIFQMKKLLESQIQNVIVNFCDNSRLSLFIFVFYKHLQVYKSKQAEFKKLNSQQLLKKRIYQKTQVNIFSPQYGSIYIDLIQQRGKVLNLTNNICDAFGYARDEMINYNIRRFMPTIYAKFHDRFLSNFIQKGKIKLLKERQRVIFAKNKKKFIFPVNIRLKAQYLLENQFGASSLINALQTNSEFIMVSQNGKLQEITENLYKRIFGNVFRDEVIKSNRLSVFKLLPSLNHMFDLSQENKPSTNKIFQGILCYSNSEDILIQKFRYARELTSTTTSGAALSGSGNQTGSKMSIMSATNNSNSAVNQSQVIEFLVQAFKVFLVDLNIFRLKGLKVSYKLSTIHTSEFDLTLVQFITIQQIEDSAFFKQFLDQLRNVAQIYGLNQQHGPISNHFNQMEQIISQNRSSQYSAFISIDKNKIVSQQKNDVEGQIRRKRQSHVQEVVQYEQLMNQQYSDNGFMQAEEGNQAQYNQEGSDRSSIIGNTQSESKKQILINAFNSKENIVSSNILFIMNLVIVALIVLLALLAYFSISYIADSQHLRDDIHFLLTGQQMIQFKIALLETQLFAKNIESTNVIPQFIAKDKITTSQKFKSLMQEINQMTLDKGLSNNFYTNTLTLNESGSNISQTDNLPAIFNKYLYMLRFQSNQNIDWLRSNYAAMRNSFRQLQDAKKQIVTDQQIFNFNRVIIILAVYCMLLILICIIVVPIYSYYKSQEQTVIGLLSYMNAKEIKKSIMRFKVLKDLLKTKENNVNVFNSIFQENTNQKKNQKEQVQKMQIAQNSAKNLKVISEQQQQSSFKKTKIFILLVIFTTFLSNFALISLFITLSAQKFFLTNLEATTLSFSLQNKSPTLVNIVLSNINRFLQKQVLINYPSQMVDYANENYFMTVGQLSKTAYTDNIIPSYLKTSYQSSICQIYSCQSSHPNGTSLNKSSTISYQYLAYSFMQKFQILLPENKLSINQTNVDQWIQQNNIKEFIMWVQELLQISQKINQDVQNDFTKAQSLWQLQLIICALVLIPFNIVIIVYGEIKFVEFLNKILIQSEEIFRHFNVSVLTENTYLTSYFNSKIKQHK